MQTVVNGILTNYELVNPKGKPTLLILHGWGQSSSHWLTLAKLISPNIRVILLDLPSFGGTKNLHSNADIPDYSKFVYDFCTKLSLKNIFLAGQSFGGQVAANFALQYPKELRRLILIDAAVVRVRNLKVKLKIILTKIIKPLVRLLPRHLRNFILSLYTPPEYVQADEHLRTILRQILKYDITPKLHLIKVPTDIIWGSEDKVIPYVGKFLAETIPDSHLHIIYGAGHLPHLTHTAKLATVMNQLFDDESA